MSSVFHWIVEVFWGNDVDSGLFDTLMKFVGTVFEYLISKMLDFFCYLISFFPDLSSYGAQVSVVLNYAARVNELLPVTELFVMCGLFFTFLTVFITMKFLLKLIPTIG
jgi:hypothetical protein